MTDKEIIEKYKKFEPFFGSWHIRRFVGEGGFAKVFEIVRTDFGDEYTSALKIITVSKTKTEINSMKSEGMSDADIRESLNGIVEDTVKEIKLMYKLRDNGNIVRYEDHAVIEHEDGIGWDILIKMEFMTSLADYIRIKRGQILKRDIIKLGIDICKALEACQKHNIIHRDIKADNIFISSETGNFKLGDFGIARIIERKDIDLSKKGTFTYMAPEVYKGQTYTSAVDIYSLGMVMYRLMNNNRAPFMPAYPKPVSMDERDRALMLRMSGEKIPKPNQVNKGRLVEIVLKACAYRPEERYSSPVIMRQELESIFYDKGEITNDDLIMVYEESREHSTFSKNKDSLSRTQSGDNAGDILSEEEDATEVLREEDATEAFREEDVTEILREEEKVTETFQEEEAATGRRKRKKQKNPSEKKFKKALKITAIIFCIAVPIIIIASRILAYYQKFTYYKYTYDEAGNLISKNEYDWRGRDLGLHRYEYDDSGNMLKDTRYYTTGTMREQQEYEYDNSGNMLKEIRYTNYGIVSWYEYEYEYDNAGNMIRRIGYDSDGNINSWHEYKYDNAGNILNDTKFSLDGSIDGWMEYEFDSLGNIIRETFRFSGGVIYEWTEYEYDNAGNMIKDTHNRNSGMCHRDEYEYDESGKVIKKTLYARNGTPLFFHDVYNDYIHYDF